MQFLLTIPAKNEEASIAEVITDFLEEACRLGIKLRVQVVDDNSSDDTFSIVEEMNIPIVRIEASSSLACVFRTEIEFALLTDADVFIHVDADGQHRAQELGFFLDEITKYDLVLGNRMLKKPAGMSDINFIANNFLSETVSILCGHQISDSQTGYRAFRRSVAERVQISASFTYTQEQIIRSIVQGFTIGEVPITTRCRVDGVSRLVKNPFYYLKNAFADIEKIALELQLPLNKRLLFGGNNFKE
jgi:glycosyltransferase involved in cell wall biosynthesis